MKRRILPALLALYMVISLLPAMAFAANESDTCPTCGCPIAAGSCCVPAIDDAGTETKQEAVCGCLESGVKCDNALCTLCRVPETSGGDGEGGDGGGAEDTPAKTCICTDTSCTHAAASAAPCGAEATGSGDLCEACEAYAKSKCTGAAGCGSRAHKENCLSLCTMAADCPNTAGDTGAHRMGYGISEGGSPARAEFATWEEAKRAADERNAELNANNPNGDSHWIPVTVRCPVAGVADDVVLGGSDDDATAQPAKPDAPAKDPGAPAKAEDFSDVPAGSWYAADLTTLMDKGIFIGQGKSFAPQSNTTGAEVVVLLSRLAGEDLKTTGTGWNLEATAWAAQQGLTEGVAISTTEGLARKDLILMLWRAAGKPGSTQSLDGFSDVDGLEGDHLAALRWAVERGIVKGSPDGAVNPDGAAKRCEMAALLARYDAAVNS